MSLGETGIELQPYLQLVNCVIGSAEPLQSLGELVVSVRRVAPDVAAPL